MGFDRGFSINYARAKRDAKYGHFFYYGNFPCYLDQTGTALTRHYGSIVSFQAPQNGRFNPSF